MARCVVCHQLHFDPGASVCIFCASIPQCAICGHYVTPGTPHTCEIKSNPADLPLDKNRPTWDQYFMSLAQAASTRATCDRLAVGCILVRDRNILSTGYNGSARGLPHCSDVGHMMEDGHCVRVIHAEMNAIIQAAKNGVAIADAICYTTASPCWPCFKGLVNAGIKAIYYQDSYRLDQRVIDAAGTLGITLTRIKEE